MRRNGRPRTLAGLGYGILAIGLVAPVVGPVAPAAAADIVISAVDFEDGTTGPWAARGVTTQVVENPDGDGHGLLISGRTAGWHGIGLELAGLFEPGTSYTFSARARVAPGATPGGTAHFTVEQRPSEGSASYQWVGNPTALSDSWVTLTGAYALPTGLSGATAYLDGDGGPYPDLLIDDIVITTEDSGGPPPTGGVILDTDFEDGTAQGWTLRDTNEPTASLDVVAGGAEGSAYALGVSGRDNQGDGPQFDVTALADPGVTYEWEAWMRFADGAEPGDLTLSARTVSGGTETFSNLTQITGVGTGWTLVGGEFTLPAFDTAAELYVETRWANGEAGNTSTFYVDDVRVEAPAPPVVQDLTPLKDTVDFPVGVAIDSRETGGSPSELLLRHFDQVTAENHMKPEAWYDAERNFRPHGEAIALMDYAQANDLRVYGHVLVWHSQTPDWFFQRADGTPLTSSDADKQILRDRLRQHVFDVAGWLADTYGPFGSDTNPLVAFDVVNEVVADGADNPDGLRRSAWFDVLGEEYIHLAFQWADEAFNDVYAAPGADRPVALFINDYNTEQGGKQDRYAALVQRLLDAGVPVDGVGHQFHVSVTAPVASLAAALDRFSGLGLVQAVTELDVTLGTTVTQALRIEQGYFYRDAFDAFRQYQAAHGDLFSVTVWGLTDGRSWRAEQEPLLFDAALQAKPAYYGAVDGELPALLRSANVFGGDVALDEGAFDAVEWRQLPPHRLSDDAGSFGLRWTADHLTVLLDVATEASDAAQVEYGGDVYTVGRDGSVTGPDGAAAVVRDDASPGWRAVVHLPHAVTQGGTGTLDVRALAGAEVVGAWNTPGSLGDLAFLEPLSYLEAPWAGEAPAVDGAVDDVWADAAAVSTDTLQSGAADGATAQVRTLWRDDTLYVLAEVTDPVIDVSSSDAYQQDSVEIFVDAGNAKNGAYRPEDAQLRISATNVASFGTGDAAAQAARLTSATALTDTGYVVEAAIDMLGTAGPGTFHGLDFQVNDGTGGTRTSVHSWAEPTGTGYQTTARWGVGQFLAPPAAPVPTVTPGASQVPAGQKLSVELAGFAPGARVSLALEVAPEPQARVAAAGSGKHGKPGKPTTPTTYALGTGTVAADGTARLTVTVPKRVPAGDYLLTASVDRAVVASAPLTVTPPLVAPTVTRQPRDVTARAGTMATFVAAASGNPDPTVQWQSRQGRGGWRDVAGATSSTLTVPVTTALGGTQYRAVFANPAGTAVTKAATLTVKPGPTPTPPGHHGHHGPSWPVHHWPILTGHHGPWFGFAGCRGPAIWF